MTRDAFVDASNHFCLMPCDVINYDDAKLQVYNSLLPAAKIIFDSLLYTVHVRHSIVLQLLNTMYVYKFYFFLHILYI